MNTENRGQWLYEELRGDEASDALKKTEMFINGEKPSLVKVCVSDMKGKDARAVVFYRFDTLTTDDRPQDNTQWAMQTASTGSNYDEMYEKITDKLNSLTVSGQIYASVSFTNAKSNAAHMAIYYPVI